MIDDVSAPAPLIALLGGVRRGPGISPDRGSSRDPHDPAPVA